MNEGEEKRTPITSGDQVFEAPQSGRRSSFIATRRYRARSDERQYAASTNLANNPNTPEFFSDAVMANTQAPRPRKSYGKLIVISVIMLVLLIGGGVALWLLSAKQQIPVQRNAHDLFNRYANYLLYGEEEKYDEIKGNYQIHKLYYYSDNKNTDRKSYLGKAVEKYSAFLDLYKKEESNYYALRPFEDYADYLARAYALEGITFYDSDYVFEQYIKEGKTAKDTINKYYNSNIISGNSVNQSAKNFYDKYKKLIEDELDTLFDLGVRGCIDRDKHIIKNECRIATSSSYTKLALDYYSIGQEMLEMQTENQTNLRNIYEFVWNLKSLMDKKEAKTDEE